MICSRCGGSVTWRGPWSNLTHTECEDCGAVNCQEVAPMFEDEENDATQAAPAAASTKESA